MISASVVYAMLANATLWQATTCCHQVPAEVEIPHSV